MTEFILFGTEGCHLCEEAELLLHEAGIDFAHKDILDNEAWQEQYGLLIPVLCHTESRRQLNWPFHSQQLQAFISLCQSRNV